MLASFCPQYYLQSANTKWQRFITTILSRIYPQRYNPRNKVFRPQSLKLSSCLVSPVSDASCVRCFAAVQRYAADHTCVRPCAAESPRCRLSHRLYSCVSSCPFPISCAGSTLGSQGVAKKQVKKQVKSTPKKVADPLFPAKKKSFRIGRDIQVTCASP